MLIANEPVCATHCDGKGLMSLSASPFAEGFIVRIEYGKCIGFFFCRTLKGLAGLSPKNLSIPR